MSLRLVSWPCQVIPRKRKLRSPEDIIDTKKNKIYSGFMFDLGMSTLSPDKMAVSTDREVSRLGGGRGSGGGGGRGGYLK